jgi:hypothetical protein
MIQSIRVDGLRIIFKKRISIGGKPRHRVQTLTPSKMFGYQELKDGIKEFWLTLTPAIRQKYIGHLKKVIPKVIEENGGPSGY